VTSDAVQRLAYEMTAVFISWLVVLTCVNNLEKYESMGRIIPYMEKKIMFETTNQ
jgi:hypothetical protein